MAEATDVSYYLDGASAELLRTLEIAIASGEVVTIDELPDDPQELVNFLEAEKCGIKYWILVCQAYTQASKPLEALAIAQLGVKARPADQAAFDEVLGWIHLKLAADGVAVRENVENAQKHLKKLLLLAQAVVHLQKDEPDLALQAFDKASKEGTNCLALLGKAQITLLKTQNYANALKLYQQVLVLNPIVKPDPRIGIGLCFWCLKDKTMAQKAWSRALEIDPSNLKARLLLNLAKFDDTLTNSISDEAFVAGYKVALEELAELHRQSPDDHAILLALALYFFSKRDFDSVEKISNRVANGAKERPSLFASKILSQTSLWLGRVAYAKEDFTRSQKCFHEAIRHNESNLLARLGLGHSQISRGLLEEAVLTLELAMKLDAKCLEINYTLGLLYARDQQKSKQEQAIQMLERYIRLASNRGLVVANKTEEDAYLNKEPVALNAYLTLSKLYEAKDISQLLVYLQKAVESREQIGKDVPLEVHNNMGVFHFVKGNDATEHFEAAQKALATVADPLALDLGVTVAYNLARSREMTDAAAATELYTKLLEMCPGYYAAKLRLLFLRAVSDGGKDAFPEIQKLLEENASDLEIRSFYGWFIKTFGKRVGLKPDAETLHQKETLVEYDSHDAYALISLANIYCVMAKELKKEDEKRRKYFVRAIELFTKVLSIDPRNVFAAQGLAIVYIENKDLTKGLDILRKIRDSLNDISVYLNLGHVLMELKQYSKLIESYEIAYVRYTNSSDAKILSFLGRAWYLRGLAEKNFGHLKKALDLSKEALEKSLVGKSALTFNIAYIQFQIADFVSKQPVEQRALDEIQDAREGLNSAIATFMALLSDDEKHPPYPKDDLRARANLGTSTLVNRLTAALEETEAHIAEVNEKFEKAKQLREEEALRKAKEQEAREAERQAREEKLALERAALQEQAQKWAEESRAQDVVADSDDEKKKKRKKKGKKADFINDSDEELAYSEEEAPKKKRKKRAKKIEDDESGYSEEEALKKKGKKRAKKADGDAEKPKARKKRVDKDGAKENEPEKASKGKRKPKLEETVQSSDDDLF